MILNDAIEFNASHILIRPDDKGVEIAFVVNGQLAERTRTSHRLLDKIITRLRILASVDLVKTAAVQKGELMHSHNGKTIHALVHFASTPDMQTVMVQIDPRQNSCPDIDQWWEQVDAASDRSQVK